MSSVLRRDYENQVCSIAGALEVVGERWTLLVVRDAFLGVRRFEQFQRRLGIARNVLQNRLERLVQEGVLERHRYQERPARYEYHLTDKGLDLWPVLMALMKWGDRHLYEGDQPVRIEHRGCGGGIDDHRVCERCGEALGPREVVAQFRRPEADPKLALRT